MKKHHFKWLRSKALTIALFCLGLMAGCGGDFDPINPPSQQLKAFCGLVWGQGGVPEKVWLGGSDGLLLKSENDGNDFIRVDSGFDYGINDLSFSPDGTYGYAVGNMGMYARSNDGGNAWSVQMLGGDFAPNLHAVTWAPSNDQLGWIVGDSGSIYFTNDQGIHWDLQNSNTDENLHGVCFFDDFQGWAVGDNGTIVGTNDGGQNWQPRDSGVSLGLRYCFNDGNFGLVAGLGGTLLRTNDFGQNWEPRDTGVNNDLHVLTVNPNKSGTVMAGGDGIILRSPDFGTNWAVAFDEFEAQFELFIKKMVYVLAGGQILATGRTDLGQGFDFESVPGLLPSDQVPSSDGLLLKSDDDGDNWFQVQIRVQF